MWLLQWQADVWLALDPVRQEAPSVLPLLVLLVVDRQKATRPSRHHLPKSRGLLAGVRDNGRNHFSNSMVVLGHFQVAPAVSVSVLASNM